MVDPVRPGREQLARARGRQLVRAVGPDERLTAQAERAQAGAELGDGGLVVAAGDVVLRAGERESRL